MKEKLIDIVRAIDSFEKSRRGTRIYAIMRVHCIYDGESKNFWFTNAAIHPRELWDFEHFGTFVSKNSVAAVKIQTNEIGKTFDYDCWGRLNRIQRHTVQLENRSDFQNQKIEIAGDSLTYQYRSISDFLNTLISNRADLSEIESKISELLEEYQTANPLKKQQITKSVNELKKEYRLLTQQQEDLKNITIYIRKQGEMRYSLIVDVIQTKIKTQNLFNGKTLIIDGGPGTGKSTTMIHRLAYLTDVFAIDEDSEKQINNFKLTNEQRKKLKGAIKLQRDWMFFSPSKLLKEYLAEAMTKEGLKNITFKVWNWKDYCVRILKEYYMLLENNNNNAPFRECKFTETLFYQKSKIIKEFAIFYLQKFKDINSQLPPIDENRTTYSWTAIALEIKKRFATSQDYELPQFIRLFNSLNSIYGNECKLHLRNNKMAIGDMVDKILSIIEENPETKKEIEEILSLTAEVNDNDYEELYEEVQDDNDDNEVEEKQNDIPISDNNKNRDNLRLELQKWLKEYCYSKIDNQKQLSAEYQLISEIIFQMLGDDYDSELQKIGELIIFEQYAQYTRGIQSLMLNCIIARYKKFRTLLCKTKHKGCNLELMRDIMHRKQGKELHHQEMSLLLGFINNLVKLIKANSVTKITHNFITAYDEVSRPIIGIDEATDFSACDIYAMQSLLTQEFSSLTLCGDMMQRMTSYGIHSWNELEGIVPNPLVVEMKTSYRQSRKLLEVAKNLYRDTLHTTPKYNAFMKSTRVPDPLVYIDKNELSKIDWISQRISEVFRAYGEQMPSIAIFVNDKGYIPRFSEYLQKKDFFVKNKIRVFDGTNDIKKTTKPHICVYPIDVVKGMEFDVVFFHNIDNSSVDINILKRYIYVGVSRAAFFLGITLSEPNELCKYFVKGKDWFKI